MADGSCAPMEEGGYQYDYLEEPPDYLQCPICLLPCKEPHILSCCGYKFCKSCIDRVRFAGQPCPHCRTLKFATLIDKEHERKILALKVHCNFRNGGCEWQGELRHIQHHLRGECHYVPVTCIYECGYKCIRRDILIHEEDECERRPMELKLIKKVESLERRLVQLEERCTNQDNLIQEQKVMITKQADLLKERKQEFETQQGVVVTNKKEIDEQIKLINENQKKIQEQVGIIENTIKLQTEELTKLREQHVEGIQTVTKSMADQFGKTNNSHDILKKELEEMNVKQQEISIKQENDTQVIQGLSNDIKTNQVSIKQIEEKTLQLKNQLDEQKDDVNKKIAHLEKKGDIHSNDIKTCLGQFEQTKGIKNELEASDANIKKELYTAIDKRITEAKEMFVSKVFHERYVENLKKMSLGFRIPDWQRPLPLTSFSNVPPCQFTMMHFSRHKDEGKAWYSPPFYSEPGGYKLCLRIDPNGMLEGKESHLSVWVYVMKGRFDDSLKWPFTGKITVQLLNWRADRGHIQNIVSFDDAAGEKVRARVTSGKYAATGRGSSKFVPHAMLPLNAAKNTDFNNGDCLCFKISKVDVH